ncbi:actin related protein 2/3 complex, subunit 5 [Pelomyxa schiedti]|nr:actin related protein 2/3 complex, subunit 5 [Pelomyxa schiedti]
MSDDEGPTPAKVGDDAEFLRYIAAMNKYNAKAQEYFTQKQAEVQAMTETIAAARSTPARLPAALASTMSNPPPLFWVFNEKQYEDKVVQLELVVKMNKLKEARGEELKAEMAAAVAPIKEGVPRMAELVQQAVSQVLTLLGLFESKPPVPIEPAVMALTQEQADALMKYLYRLLSTGDNANLLLKWHEFAFKKGGHGSIVRVFTDKTELASTLA